MDNYRQTDAFYPQSDNTNDESHQPIPPNAGAANTETPVSNPVANVPLSASDDNTRVLPRQVPTGAQRGTQTIAGTAQVIDPNTKNPVIATSGVLQNQTFSNPTTKKNLIIQGKQSDNTYGQRVLDLNGNVVAHFGQQTDGTVNLKFFAAPTSTTSKQGLGIAQFGQFPDGSISLRVAKPNINVDVSSATNAQLVFNSSQDIFKVVGKYTAAFSYTSGASASATTTSITHNLGYVPLAFCVVNITTNQINGGETGVLPLPYILFGIGGGTTNVFVALAFVKLFRADSSTLTFQIGAQGNTLTLAGTITAYILQETAT